MALKHVGRLKNNKNKVVVAYRTIPGDAKHAVVVNTPGLSADEHDSLMKYVESQAGQDAYEFAEMMARATLPDGRNMLAAFHQTGKMMKVASDTVEMTPNTNTVINLKELNETIAEQKGVTVADLALSDPQGNTVQPVVEENNDPTLSTSEVADQMQAPSDGVISDEELAASYRSQADALFKEASTKRASRRTCSHKAED